MLYDKRNVYAGYKKNKQDLDGKQFFDGNNEKSNFIYNVAIKFEKQI